MQIPCAGQPAGAHRGDRLDDIPACPARVYPRVHEDDQTHDLVLLEHHRHRQAAGHRQAEQRRPVQDPVVVAVPVASLADRRQHRHPAQYQQRIARHADLRHQPPDARLAGGQQALHRRDGGKHQRQPAQQQHEQQMANARPGQQRHGQKDRTVDQRRAHVRLQHDQGHRRRHHQQSEQKARQFGDAIADLRQVGGQKQNGGDLDELGRLDAQSADAQPGTRAVHLPPEHQGEHQQRQGGEKDVRRTRLVVLMIGDREYHHQHQAAGRPHDLLDPLVRYRNPGRVHAAGVHEQNAGAHQRQAGQQQYRIESTQGAEPGSEYLGARGTLGGTLHGAASSSSGCRGLNTASPYHGLR